MCRLQNIAMHDYQESVTIGQTHGQTDRQTPDKVISMCRYASQAIQQSNNLVGYMYTNNVPGILECDCLYNLQ